MSRTVFWSVYTPFALLALVAGWMLGTPHPHAAAGAPSSLQAAGPSPTQASAAVAAAPPVAEGADAADGWPSRQALRAALSASLDRVESAPCEPDARAAFLTAYADRAGAISDAASASSSGNRPAFWSTSDDDALDQRVTRLEGQHWFTQDEVGLAVVRRRLGDGLLAAQAGPDAIQKVQAAGDARCPNLAVPQQARG